MFSFQWVHMKTVTSYLTFQVCSEVWCVLHICTQGQWGLGTCHGLLSHTELAAPSWTAQLTAWACGGRGASSISVRDAATLRSLSASRWGHSPTPGDWTRLGLPQAAVGHWQRGASVRWRTGYRTIRSEVGLDWSPNLWELQSTTEPLKTIFFFFYNCCLPTNTLCMQAGSGDTTPWTSANLPEDGAALGVNDSMLPPKHVPNSCPGMAFSLTTSVF